MGAFVELVHLRHKHRHRRENDENQESVGTYFDHQGTFVCPGDKRTNG
jgi:hypothetical protein